MKRHVMLDLETLGTKPGCPVIAIGAVCFIGQVETRDHTFYCTINHDQSGIMDEPDPKTVEWWKSQSPEAQAEVFDNPRSIDLVAAVHKFKQFLQQLQVSTEDEIVIWGKGASFDEPVIAECFNRLAIPVQWSFRNSMCFRTLETLGNMYDIHKPEFTGVKHNALSDAKYQAECASIIFDHFNTRMPG